MGRNMQIVENLVNKRRVGRKKNMEKWNVGWGEGAKEMLLV